MLGERVWTRPEEWAGEGGVNRGLNGGGGGSAGVNIMQLYNYMYERFRNVRITLCI